MFIDVLYNRSYPSCVCLVPSFVLVTKNWSLKYLVKFIANQIYIYIYIYIYCHNATVRD